MRFLLIGIGLVLVGAAQAAEPPSPVLGAGNATCSLWSSVRREGDPSNEAAVISWIHGYLTAINEWVTATTGRPENIVASTPATAAAVDADLWAFIDNYCAENPLASLHAAATALTDALLSREGVTLPH
jgi:hypothetical protein